MYNLLSYLQAKQIVLNLIETVIDNISSPVE